MLAAYEDESSASAEQQFNELCESPEGTAVTLRDGRDRRRRMNGYLTNVRTGYDGEPYWAFRSAAKTRVAPAIGFPLAKFGE